MPSATELAEHPQPRCPVMCRNVDTNRIERCARWADHEPPEEHNSYKEIIEDMVHALLQAEGSRDLDLDDLGMAGLVYLARARMWYIRITRIETVSR